MPIGENILSEKRRALLFKQENTFHSTTFSTESDSGSLSRLSSPDEKRSQTDGNGNDKDEGIEVDIDTEYSVEGIPVPDLKQSELILLSAVTALSRHRADCQETVTVKGVCYACTEGVACN